MGEPGASEKNARDTRKQMADAAENAETIQVDLKKKIEGLDLKLNHAGTVLKQVQQNATKQYQAMVDERAKLQEQAVKLRREVAALKKQLAARNRPAPRP